MDLIDICYTPAIAQSLLQIQQAQSKVDARQLIVHGACSIVTDSLEALARKGIDLDSQHQANLVGLKQSRCHDDLFNILLPNHEPEVDDISVGRTLSSDVFLIVIVTL